MYPIDVLKYDHKAKLLNIKCLWMNHGCRFVWLGSLETPPPDAGRITTRISYVNSVGSQPIPTFISLLASCKGNSNFQWVATKNGMFWQAPFRHSKDVLCQHKTLKSWRRSTPKELWNKTQHMCVCIYIYILYIDTDQKRCCIKTKRCFLTIPTCSSDLHFQDLQKLQGTCSPGIDRWRSSLCDSRSSQFPPKGGPKDTNLSMDWD